MKKDTLITVLADYCKNYSTEKAAARSLQEALATLTDSPAYSDFCQLTERYPSSDWHFAQDLSTVAALSDTAGIHSYVIQFLYCIALLPAAKNVWLHKGFTEQDFTDAFADLGYKLTECYKMYGIYGSFVAGWFDRWYDASRFSLGRLQFELIPCSCVPGIENGFTHNGIFYAPDTQLINIHIPSSGHMPHDSVLDAYRRAAAFFRLHFANDLPKDKPLAFVCESWLLWPDGRWFLPAQSNVRPFMDDFTILYAQPDQNGNLWRTTYVEWKGSADDLPEDTSYNRAWKDWMKKGGCCGFATGVFLWDDRKELPV